MVRRMSKTSSTHNQLSSKSVDEKKSAYAPPKIIKSWRLVARAQIPSVPGPP